MRIPCPLLRRARCPRVHLSRRCDRGAARPGRRRRAQSLCRLRLCARQSGRTASRVLVSRLGLPSLARRQSAIPAPMKSWAVEPASKARGATHDRVAANCAVAVSAGQRADWLIVTPRSRLPWTADHSAACPETRSPRRCWRPGQRVVGRSFKYHRPRGVMTAGSEEPNALVELRSGARREPNTKATTIELYDGLDASDAEWLAIR